nr:MAG TPA: hypothetical protein [Caudoviricetes sp.]
MSKGKICPSDSCCHFISSDWKLVIIHKFSDLIFSKTTSCSQNFYRFSISFSFFSIHFFELDFFYFACISLIVSKKFMD